MAEVPYLTFVPLDFVGVLVWKFQNQKIKATGLEINIYNVVANICYHAWNPVAKWNFR